MKLIVGLGNIGKEYEKTNHNIGFIVVDKLAEKLQAGKFLSTKFDCTMCKVNFGGETILIAKPTTYMNASGISVQKLIHNYKLEAKDVLVICDDIDLQLGTFRFRTNGSGGTHNGLKSIVGNIGNDFNRIRVGIGKDNNVDLADYVLSKMGPEKEAIINSLLPQILLKIEEFIENYAR